MADPVSVRVVGVQEIVDRLGGLKPGKHKRWLRKAMTDAALAIQAEAAENQIVRGRGEAAPLADKLSRRTGRLGGSIAVDRGGLPFSVSTGTDVVYGLLHELGGTVSYTRKARKSKRVGPRKGKTRAFDTNVVAKFPARPFLQPALDVVSPRFASIFVRRWKEASE